MYTICRQKSNRHPSPLGFSRLYDGFLPSRCGYFRLIIPLATRGILKILLPGDDDQAIVPIGTRCTTCSETRCISREACTAGRATAARIECTTRCSIARVGAPAEARGRRSSSTVSSAISSTTTSCRSGCTTARADISSAIPTRSCASIRRSSGTTRSCSRPASSARAVSGSSDSSQIRTGCRRSARVSCTRSCCRDASTTTTTTEDEHRKRVFHDIGRTASSSSVRGISTTTTTYVDIRRVADSNGKGEYTASTTTTIITPTSSPTCSPAVHRKGDTSS